MNRMSKFSLFSAVSFVAITKSIEVFAYAPAPTLDNLKKQSLDYSVETPFVLQTNEPGNMNDHIIVQISGVNHYFKLGTDTLARALSVTPAGNLVSATVEDAVFEIGGSYYKFDTDKLPKSSHRYVNGTSEDYNFLVKKTDEDGKLLDEFYKIAFEDDKDEVLFGTSENIKWKKSTSEETDIVEIKLPHNGNTGDTTQDKRYYKYTYSPTDGRGKYTQRQTGLSGAVDSDFVGGNITIESFSESNNCMNGEYACGGGLFVNYGDTIGNINGSFLGNSAISKINDAHGGAFYNISSSGSTIGNITGDFIGNYVISEEDGGRGGAIYHQGMIYNEAKIGSIIGDFIGNYSIARYAYGGAIYSYYGNIDNVVGAFIGNHVKSIDSYSEGGAIYLNMSTIKNITGDFIGNYATGNYVFGGAIYNDYSTIKNITGDFINNHINSETSSATGGAIYNGNSAIINNIKGDFIENFSIAKNSQATGGAITNRNGIDNITGNFIGNYVIGSYAAGGAINNENIISLIAGDFIGNHASSTDSVYGGAIYNNGTITSLTGNFIGNHITGLYAAGGALDNADTIYNLTGDFIGNYASSTTSDAFAGAILNNGKITLSTTEAKKTILFENNKVITYAGTENEKIRLNSINFNGSDVVVNFDTIANSYINIRDPMTTFDWGGVVQNFGTLNKTGAGAFYLWGDNSEFGGTMNINEGEFIALFEEAEDLINDPFGQRRTFNLSNAKVNFADGTTFRPMVTATKIADLGKVPTVGSDVNLRPFNVSSLNKGDYNYAVDYSQFKGIENELIKVDATGTSLDVSIKKNLAGYEGLGSAVDAYRKLSSLSVSDRMIFDNIYYTGSVSQEIKDQFKEVINVISGEDKIIINEVHKASVRQFSRQIYSRVQNKNCPSCGMTEGYSDEHLWFNVGKNFIDKDTNGENVGYKYDPTSLAIGYDHDIIPNALNMGIAFSYAFGDVKGKGKSIYNTADIDEYMLSLYWKYKPLRAYTTGSIGGGYMNSNSKVRGDSIDVTGDSDTIIGFINTEFGYDFGNACGVLEPFVGLEYAYIYNKAYTEKGLGARHFNSSDYNSIELPIGFRVSRNMVLDSYIFTPSIELAYARSLGDRTSEVSSYFVGSPESPWVMRGANDSRDSLRSSLNLKVNNIYNPFALNFGYARDTRSDYSDDQLYLTVRYNF